METGICMYCEGTGIHPDYLGSPFGNRLTVGDLYKKSIAELLPDLPTRFLHRTVLETVDKLGISHLSLSRPVRTLSAGEYQALYLVSCLSRMRSGKDYLLVLDEPTKGLSQNIVNRLMETIRQIQRGFSSTILYIEHSPYMLDSADYVIDFGKEREDRVRSVPIFGHEQWLRKRHETSFSGHPRLSSRSNNPQTGLRDLRNDHTAITVFNDAQTKFHSLLKSLSNTAEWKYSAYSYPRDVPVLALNMAASLYSEHTPLFDIADTAARIVSVITDSPDLRSLFDFKNAANRCLSCKGSGLVSSIDFKKCVKDESCLWNAGFLDPAVTEALRNYNFARVSRMFVAFKKATGLDLSKPITEMSALERQTLLYGDWHYLLPGKEGSVYHWRGLNFLIQKYMKESKSPLKEILKQSLHSIVCPVCGGRTLQHKGQLTFRGKDVGEWLSLPLQVCASVFNPMEELSGLATIFGNATPLNAHIETFSRIQRACAKIFEIKMCRFSGISIFLRNLPRRLPDYAREWIEEISKANEVVVCSESEMQDSVTSSHVFKGARLADSAFVYQFFGLQNLDKVFKQLKKEFPCRFCKGRGHVDINSDNVDFYNLTETCAACSGSGIDGDAQLKEIDGFRISTLLSGNLHAIDARYPEGVFIPLCSRLRDLSTEQLETLLSVGK